MTGHELQAFRKRLGLTQARLAKHLGVTRNSVARWEMGIMEMREPIDRLLRTLTPKKSGRRHAKRTSR
jgi:DNA-binding transcriptional regulator YiaG